MYWNNNCQHHCLLIFMSKKCHIRNKYTQINKTVKRHFLSCVFFLFNIVSSSPSGQQKPAALELENSSRTTWGTAWSLCAAIWWCTQWDEMHKLSSSAPAPSVWQHLLQKQYRKGLAGGLHLWLCLWTFPRVCKKLEGWGRCYSPGTCDTYCAITKWVDLHGPFLS